MPEEDEEEKEVSFLFLEQRSVRKKAKFRCFSHIYNTNTVDLYLEQVTLYFEEVLVFPQLNCLPFHDVILNPPKV